MDTLDPTVPPPGDPEPWRAAPGPRRRSRWWWLGPVGAVVVLALIGSAFVSIPYYSVSPGEARGTEPLISVGEGGPKHPSKGEILFTTVRLRRVTVLEAVEGWLDPAVDVFEKEEILGDQSDEENRRLNRRLMASSKEQAAAVALEELGYNVVKGDGAVVTAVEQHSPAEGTLRPGEIIVGLDGGPIALADDLALAVRARKPGAKVTLDLRSADGEAIRKVTVPLADLGDGTAFLGVRMETRNLKLDFPYEVDIDSGEVGGPSAGLAFTLAALDLLTAGELTGGSSVAATGTIGLRGQVGPVGGVAQKTATVKRAHVDVFLVPREEYDQVKRRAGSDLRVEPVSTLDDALKVLASLGGNALTLGRPGERTGGTERT